MMLLKSKDDEKLLFEYLTKQQLKDYQETGCFWVVAPDRRVYQLSDGKSLWRFRDGRAEDSRHVWASGRRRSSMGTATKETSLLTQLLFLTSDSADELVAIGCGEITFQPKPKGCPKMRGWKAVRPRKVKIG